MSYDRIKAVNYAKTWALRRNPNYYDFSSLGGDCTNFCSQCLYAGSSIMNYTPVIGWYYISINNRAPAWSGVNEFYNFLINNNGVGPFGEVCNLSDLEVGDFIELGNEFGFYHCLFVSGFSGNIPLVCSHSYDRLNAPLTVYYYERVRFIKIQGVNY